MSTDKSKKKLSQFEIEKLENFSKSITIEELKAKIFNMELEAMEQDKMYISLQLDFLDLQIANKKTQAKGFILEHSKIIERAKSFQEDLKKKYKVETLNYHPRTGEIKES